MGKFLLCIVGPTGIGKSDVALSVAKVFNAEIISADSRQIFSEMKIGTAAPDENMIREVPHHFIASNSIKDEYNASRYEQEVLQFLRSYFDRKDVAVLVGGSMMYVDTLLHGIDDIPKVPEIIRHNLNDEFNQYGLEPLLTELQAVDPEYYETVDRKNPVRIKHALEIVRTTGSPYSTFMKGIKRKTDFNVVLAGLNCDRNLLHERLNNRVDLMITCGLLEEVKNLYPYRNLIPLKTVGYQELFPVLENKYSLEVGVGLVKRNTRRYARKQIGWFGKYKDCRWFLPGETNMIISYFTAEIERINLLR